MQPIGIILWGILHCKFYVPAVRSFNPFRLIPVKPLGSASVMCSRRAIKSESATNSFEVALVKNSHWKLFGTIGAGTGRILGEE